MATHVRVLAVLFIVFGAACIVFALFVSVGATALTAFLATRQEDGAAIGAAVMGFTGVALAVFLLIVAVPQIICGWGLLKLRRWARILAIVLAALSLIRFPLGTIFGAYALWVLFQKDTEALLNT